MAIRLRNAEQGSPELAQYRSLSVQAINFHPDRRCQRRVRCIPAKFTEFMLEVLLGLRRDVPLTPFPLEFGDKLSGDGHALTIEETGHPGSGTPRTNVPIGSDRFHRKHADPSSPRHRNRLHHRSAAAPVAGRPRNHCGRRRGAACGGRLIMMGLRRFLPGGTGADSGLLSFHLDCIHSRSAALKFTQQVKLPILTATSRIAWISAPHTSERQLLPPGLSTESVTVLQCDCSPGTGIAQTIWQACGDRWRLHQSHRTSGYPRR